MMKMRAGNFQRWMKTVNDTTPRLTAWRSTRQWGNVRICAMTFMASVLHPQSGWRLSKKRMQEEYVKGKIVVTNGKLERRSYD